MKNKKVLFLYGRKGKRKTAGGYIWKYAKEWKNFMKREIKTLRIIIAVLMLLNIG